MRNRDTGAIELAETMEREALFRALERSLMEDLRPSIALEALFAGAVPPEFEPLRRSIIRRETYGTIRCWWWMKRRSGGRRAKILRP